MTRQGCPDSESLSSEAGWEVPSAAAGGSGGSASASPSAEAGPLRPSKEEPKEEVILAALLGPKWSLRCSKEFPERCDVAQDASAAASNAPDTRHRSV